MRARDRRTVPALNVFPFISRVPLQAGTARRRRQNQNGYRLAPLVPAYDSTQLPVTRRDCYQCLGLGERKIKNRWRSMTGKWALALEQSSELEVNHGSPAGVATALKSGPDLRLFLIAKGYEETLYFQQTYAGENDAFAGLMTYHHSYAHRGSLADQPYFSFFRYDASGTFSQVKWMWDNRTFDETQPYAYGIYRWYVCDRWRVVYEHDGNGNPVIGDLDELKEHIRAGHSLKVGVNQLFGLQSDHPSGPEHLSFLDIMQPLIKDGHVEANCDFILTGAPQWPFRWEDGLMLGMVWPWSSGEIICHLVEPGHLPFRRSSVRRAMQWLIPTDERL